MSSKQPSASITKYMYVKRFFPIIFAFFIIFNAFFPTKALATSVTFNPTAGSGRCYYLSSPWSTAHSATTATGCASDLVIRSNFNGSSYDIHRSFLPFDTSSIPDDATINSASLQLFRLDSLGGFSNSDTDSVVIVPSTQSSSSSLATSDYDNLAFSSKGDKLFSLFTNNAYTTINLTDITGINVSGNSLYSIISGRDNANSAPTGDNLIIFEDGSSTHKPILTVDYTPFSSPTPSPSPTPPESTQSATLVQFNDVTQQGITDILKVLYTFFGIVVLYIGWQIGTFIFRR